MERINTTEILGLKFSVRYLNVFPAHNILPTAAKFDSAIGVYAIVDRTFWSQGHYGQRNVGQKNCGYLLAQHLSARNAIAESSIFARRRSVENILRHRACATKKPPSDPEGLPGGYVFLDVVRSPRLSVGFSGQLLSAIHERPNSFGEQSCVEWFSERFAEHRTVKAGSVVIVAKKTNQNGFVEFCIPTKVLGNHQSFFTPHNKVHHHAIGVNGFCLDSSFKATGSYFDLKVVVGNHLIQTRTSRQIRTNEQNFAHCFVFQLAERHSVFLKETDQMFARYASIL
jgi:hypothetical protein